jgi:hypothetical protein
MRNEPNRRQMNRNNLEGEQMTSTYLQKKRDNHIKFGHHKMAEKMVADLRVKHATLTIEGPCDWENGRYIAVFLTLVPDSIRMLIQLTDSGLNQHVYNLKPMSEGKVDVDRFVNHMTARHPDVPLQNAGLYAKLPAWKNRRASNTDLQGVSEQVLHAQRFFVGTSATGSSA